MEQCQQPLNDIKPILDKLQKQWDLYLTSNEDLEAKKNNLELFLFNFQFVDSNILQHEDFKNFFNTIPEEICSYFLELVYEIINQSNLFSASQLGLIENHDEKDAQKYKDNLRKHHNFAQLILKTPGDCNKIIALRTFLTDQLGQHLLKFLIEVDIKLIASQKSLCNLCINLFPNCLWTQTVRKLKKTISLNDILSNFYFYQKKLKNKYFLNQSFDNLRTPQTPISNDPSTDCNDGLAKDFENFRLEKKTSDEIALMLIKLLKKCILEENETILTDQSMTIIALKFALNCLQSPNDDINYGSPQNAEIIKCELLHIIQLCCNNLFMNSENANAVQFPIIFAKLNEALNNNNTKHINITCALIFLILSILYNVTAIYGNQPRYNNCKNHFKSQKFIDKNVIEKCMEILQKLPHQQVRTVSAATATAAATTATSTEATRENGRPSSPPSQPPSTTTASQAIFAHIFKTLLRITDQLSKCEKLMHHNGSDMQLRSQSRKKQNLKHNHCNRMLKEQQQQPQDQELLSCFFQKTLLHILPSLNLELQEQAMRYLLRSGVCCCHYTLTSYENILKVALGIGPNYQRCAYKFLQRFILSGIFLRTPNMNQRKRHEASCPNCDEKFKSRDFQDGLLRLYIYVHEQLAESPDFLSLEIYLKHLKRISHLLPYDIASGILAEIVLPIFRKWKLKIVPVVSEKSSSSTTPSNPVKSFWLNKTRRNDSGNGSNDPKSSSKSNSPTKLHLNIAAAKEEALALEQQSYALNILNECLNIFAMYLCDIRLVKAFYNEENIKHLEDLLNEPELIRGICDLIKIGIDNITFLGDNNQEQLALSRRLINLQLNSSDRAAQLFTDLLNRLAKSSPNNKQKLWLDGGTPIQNDFINNTSKNLNTLHILHITALQWSLNYDLLKTSQLFYNEFAKTYSIVVVDDDHLSQENNHEDPSASGGDNYDQNAITQEELHPNFLKHGDKTIIDILKLNYNALSCFLMLPATSKTNNTNNNNKHSNKPSLAKATVTNASTAIPSTAPVTSSTSKLSFPRSNSCFDTKKEQNENITTTKNAKNVRQQSLPTAALPTTPPPPPLPSSLPHLPQTQTTFFATTLAENLFTSASASISSPHPPSTNTTSSTLLRTETVHMENKTIDCFSSSLENVKNNFPSTSTTTQKPLQREPFIYDFSTKSAFTPVTYPLSLAPIFSNFNDLSSKYSSLTSDDTESDLNSSLGSYHHHHQGQQQESFLQKLQTKCISQIDENILMTESIVLFDIRNQLEKSSSSSNNLNQAEKLITSSETNLEDYLFNGKPIQTYLNQFPESNSATLNSSHHASQGPAEGYHGLIGNIFNIFGWLFGGSHESNSNSFDDHQDEATLTEEENEQLTCLYQVNGDCKKLLLKLFEATMAICVKGYQNEEVEKMQKHLRKLKAVILGSASANWQQHAEEQTRDNLIIQTLQTLLKIAELSTTLNEPAAVISSSLGATVTDDDRLPMQYQARSMRCSQMALTPVLPAVNAVATPPTPRRPISGESVDADYFSTRASLICADSELEFSDNNDDFYLTADEGYEADGEVPDATDTDGDCIEAVDLWNSLQPTSRYRTHILHDGLCRLVVDILIELSKMCVENPKGWSDSLAQLANRLFIIRDYLGGPLFLLRGFQPILEFNDPRLRELQQSLLDLIGELNTPDVLTTFFSILSSKNAPVDILMNNMHFICTNTLKRPLPYVELEFPISTDGKCISTCEAAMTEQIDRMRNYHMQCQANTPITRAPLIIPITHAKLWNNDGFTASLWFNAKGSPNSQKTTSQIIEDDSRSSNDDCMKTHIVSLGTNQAMISVYINNNMNLVFEICKPNAEVQMHLQSNPNDNSHQFSSGQQSDKKSSNSSQSRNQNGRSESSHLQFTTSPLRNALKQTKLVFLQGFRPMHLFNGHNAECDQHFEVSYVDLKHCRITRNKWTHLSFAVESLQDRLDVSIFIDGLERHVITLPFKNIKNLIRTHVFQMVALGDGAVTKSPNTSSCTDSRSTLDSHPIRLGLTNFMLFNRKISVRECYLNLTAMGPDFIEFTQCQVGNWKPNYGYLNLSRMPNANFGSLSESMRLLKLTRILSYTAQQPDVAMGYEANVEIDSTFYGKPYGIMLYGELIQNQLSSLQTAVTLSGGLSTLLYLFARVVEASNSSYSQSMALDMLLRVSMSDSQLFTEFLCNDFINLIGFVIKSDRCTKDVSLLKSIINNACTHQVISKKGEALIVNENTMASIVHPRLIISILHRYSDWHRSGVEQSKVLEMLFQCIIALTREKHPHRDFNMEQLTKAGLVRELLNICKVYIIESPNPVYISKMAASYFVQILAIFAGSPPSPSLMDEIMKLLLLLHKPSECYVTDDRQKFYFLLTSKSPTKERPLSGVNLSRVAAPFRRTLLKERPGFAMPIKNTPPSMNSAALNDFDSDRLARIQRLRKLHAKDYPSYKRPVHQLEESLESIADCSKLNKGALRLLNPVEAARCHLKVKKKVISTQGLLSPKKVHSSTKEKIKSVAVLSPVNNNSLPTLQSKVTRKRLRSTNSLKYSESEKRLRRDRQSKSSLHSLTAVLQNFDSDNSEMSTLNDVFSSTPIQRRSKALVKTDFYKYEGIIALQEGLFLMLKDFLCLLPDATVDEVLRHYVKVEYLLVLANHSHCSVRTAIIKLLTALTQRLPQSDINAYIKSFYPQHLGNQLAIHPSDANMFEACVTWLTGVYGSIETFLHIDHLQIHQRFGLNALLAIITKATVQQNDFADLSIKVLRRIYLMNPEEHQAFIEAGLLQACMKALYNLYAQNSGIYNTKTEDAIIELLTIIGERSLKSMGQINIVWEILNILSFYQNKQPMTIVKSFRSVQSLLQLNWINMFFVKTNVPWNFKVASLPNCQLTASEIKTRLDLLVDRCSQFFALFDGNYVPSANEINLFELLVSYGISTNQRCNNFIAWGLLPSRPRDLRAFIIDALWISCQDDFLPSIICDGKMIKSLLWLSLHEDLDKPIENLQRLCHHLGITENDSTWNLENELERIEINRSTISAKQISMLEKTVFKFESLAQNCIETSMITTRRVAELQNAERKLLMSHMKDYDDTQTYTQWVDIIRRSTHEGAPWYNERYAETSWELDDTEGPSRVHTRMRRCHLDIDKRFFMEDYTNKSNKSPSNSKMGFKMNESMTPMSKSTDLIPTKNATGKMESSTNLLTTSTNNSQEYVRPLEYLVSSYDQQMNLSLNSQIHYNFPAKYLPVDEEIDGEIIITDHKLYFFATYRCKYFYVNCDISNIAEIWLKRYQHQEKAFEIFLDTNKSLFFSLQNQEDWRIMCEVFCGKIVATPDQSKIMAITQQWRDGLLTNWEYLMTLNQIAGRTYNDLMQYPVFPWILNNYTGHVLDLTDPKNFRKMEKPIAVQNPENEKHYINNYMHMSNVETNMGSFTLKPYHYSSHYSNSGTVLYYLVRVPPFTSYFLRYQDNNFDLPDRTFHELGTAWCLASRDSPTDVKELIPEFFCLPEMFENFEHFNFGIRQSGERVENVSLPPWCSNDARLFILIHRQALESELVRSTIHNWIDLIFGYKQTGESAVEAVNVFHPATYPSFLESQISDPIQREAVETMVKTLGQMPRQLFKVPHPSTKVLNYSLLDDKRVIPSVNGLRWGIYAGSPQLPPPSFQVHKLQGAEYLVSFSNTNVVYGLPSKSGIMQGAEPDTYNVISWGHEDRIVRIQPLNKAQTKPRNLLQNNAFDNITACGCDPNSNQLWFGHKSGRISVYKCNGIAGDPNSRQNKARQSYVRSFRLSYNSAFRKITTKSGGNLDLETESQNQSLSTSTSSTTLSGISGTIESQQRDGADLSWLGPTVLIRHTDEITCISLSVEYKIAVSAGRDGIAVIWDLNNWSYVRTIERPAEIHQSPITLIAISPTLGDIVTVHSILHPQSTNVLNDNAHNTHHNSRDYSNTPTSSSSNLADECFEVTEDLDDFVNVSMNLNGKSILRLHTVNARYVQHMVLEERILAVCYSYIKEGVGVNVIATAIEGGMVRLWSSWNLTFVTEIITGMSNIKSITYSTHQHLIVLTKDSYIQVWETEGLSGNSPKFPQIAYK